MGWIVPLWNLTLSLYTYFPILTLRVFDVEHPAPN